MKLPSFRQKSKFSVHLMTLHNQLCGDFDGCIIMLCTISILDTQASTDEGNSHVQTIPSIASPSSRVATHPSSVKTIIGRGVNLKRSFYSTSIYY